MYVTGKEALNPEFSLLNLYLYSLVLKMSIFFFGSQMVLGCNFPFVLNDYYYC